MNESAPIEPTPEQVFGVKPWFDRRKEERREIFARACAEPNLIQPEKQIGEFLGSGMSLPSVTYEILGHIPTPITRHASNDFFDLKERSIRSLTDGYTLTDTIHARIEQTRREHAFPRELKRKTEDEQTEYETIVRVFVSNFYHADVKNPLTDGRNDLRSTIRELAFILGIPHDELYKAIPKHKEADVPLVRNNGLRRLAQLFKRNIQLYSRERVDDRFSVYVPNVLVPFIPEEEIPEDNTQYSRDDRGFLVIERDDSEN